MGFDEIGHRGRIVEIKQRHVEIEADIAGDRQQARVVLRAAAQQGVAALGAMHLDLRQAALLEPLGEDDVDVAEIGGEQLLDGGRAACCLTSASLAGEEISMVSAPAAVKR